jgi:penicillin amidase
MTGKRSGWTSLLRWGFVFVLLLLVGVPAMGFLLLRGSLPPLEGDRAVAGLEASITVTRDARGVVAVQASSDADGFFGLGFAHGQDRFFQMDLVRRLMAGTLAELVGEAALDSDFRMRSYGYAGAAALHLAALPAHHHAVLTAYVAGVNAGLGSLRRPSPEYLLLRTRPAPWTELDALLTYLYFYDGLSTHYRDEFHLRELDRILPAEVVAILTPEVSRFDRPVPGLEGGDLTGGYRPLPIPGPDIWNLREEVSGHADDPAELRAQGAAAQRIYGDPPGGSNAWVVSDPEGPALVASDPHLAHQVPGIWYRAEIHTPEAVLRGATLPGVPGFFVGMTDALAWGPTAAVVDQTDLVLVTIDPTDASRYRTPDGAEPFIEITETFQVLRGEPRSQTRRVTRWGPIIRTTHDGIPVAFRSPAFDPGGLTLQHLELARATTVHDGLAVVRAMGGPGLAVVLGDRGGRGGWAVSGVLPAREGISGRRPVDPLVEGEGWNGSRPESDRPISLDSLGGYLFAANHRFTHLDQSASLSGMWMSPTRAFRVDELLRAERSLDEAHHQRLQLDLVSVKHLAVRDLVLGLLAPEVRAEDPALERLHALASSWDGTADPASPHFTAMEASWRAVRQAALAPLIGPVAQAVPGFRYGWPLAHEGALRILEERPQHLLPADWDSWDDYLVDALRQIPETRLEQPWGDRNRAAIRHPLAQAVPALGRFLNMPRDPLPGWSGVVRAQGPTYGQSLRFVGRPGRPEAARLDLPGGQSGHPLSRWYGADHADWVEGRGAPLQAGVPIHTLHLRPVAR